MRDVPPHLLSLFKVSAIRYFAGSLIGTFSALFIIKILNGTYDFPLPEAIMAAVFYFAVMRLLVVIGVIPLTHLFLKIGLKYGIMAGSVLGIGSNILWLLFPTYSWTLVLAIFCDALSVPAYWVCYHLYFTAEEKPETTGKEVGLVTILNDLAQVLGPVAGGIIITYFGGFTLLLATNAVLLLLSNLPLYQGLPAKEYPRPKSLNFLKSIPRHYFIGYMGYGAEDTLHGVLWPILLWLFIPSYAGLGLMTTILLLISGLLVMAAGRLIDLKGSKQVLEGSVFLVGLSWLGQLLSQGLWPLTVASGFYTVSKAVMSTAADALTYQKARKEDPVQFLIGRNIAIDLGKAVALFAVLVLLYLGWSLQSTFSLGIVAVAVAGLLAYRKTIKRAG